MALRMFTWLPSFLFLFAVFYSETSAQNSNLTTTNDTLSTTTPAIVSTTTEGVSTTPIPPKPLPANKDIGPCPCDLTAHGCDVNCCCDPDCSTDDRTSFTECITFNSIVDDRLCFQEDIFSAVNSKLPSNKSSNGIFCIYYDNYPARNFYKNPDLVTDTTTFEEYTRKYSIPSFQQPVQEEKEFAEFYKSGDPMLIMPGNETLRFLNLPKALTSEYCADSNPASYLIDQTFQCVRNIPDLSSECELTLALKASTYFQNIRIIPSPGIFQDSNITYENITTDFLDELYNSNQTFPFSVIKLCKGLQCQVLNGTNNNTNILTTYNMTENTCYNVVEKVFYEMKYHGTTGLTSMNINLHLINVSGPNIRLTQTFGTEFKQNQTKGNSYKKSGNPGYIKSEPIIAGNMKQIVSGQKNVYVIEMNRDRDNWLTLPQSTASGDCSSTTRVPIKFGENLLTGCIMRVTNDELQNSCSQLQNRTTNILLGNSLYTHVASFGNTLVEDAGDWLPILGLHSKPELLPFSHENCPLMLGIQIQIMFARVGSISNSQAKIIGVMYNFIRRSSINPLCVGLFCEGNFTHSLELVGSVAYQEVSQPVVGIIADPPAYQLGLPFDFFYPFVNNEASDQHLLMKANRILLISFIILINLCFLDK